MAQLDGKTALITGGVRGFGRIVALLLAREGADIAVADIVHNLPSQQFSPMATTDQLIRTVQEIQSRGRSATAIQADVTRAEDCERMAEETLQAYGKIDILIANAGVWTKRPAWELTEEEWDSVVDINLKGTWLTTKYVVPHMISRRYGKIVMISSVAGLKAYSQYAHYIAAKHGVIGYMKSLALELGPYEINVNAICPTQMGRPEEGGALDPDAGKQNLFEAQGTPGFSVVAEGVLWLVSDRSRLVTGHALPMDAGWVVKRGG